MNIFEKKLKKAAEQIRLSKMEKERMWNVLEGVMEIQPVREAQKQAQKEAAQKEAHGRSYESNRFVWISIFRTKKVIMPALLIIALFLGGGVSAAAQNTVPGDILYPVKVGITEEIRGFAALGTENKAEWEEKRAERRLREATELASRGELSAKHEAAIEKKLVAHTTRVIELSKKLEDNGQLGDAINVQANLDAALSSHITLVAIMGSGSASGDVSVMAFRTNSEADSTDDAEDTQSNEDKNTRSVADIATKVKTLLESEGMTTVAMVPPSALEARSSIMVDNGTSTPMPTEPEPDGRDPEALKQASVSQKTIVEKRLVEARELKEKVASTTDPFNSSRYDAYVSSINLLTASADEYYKNANYSASFRTYHAAHIEAQKLLVYLRALSWKNAGIETGVEKKRIEMMITFSDTTSTDEAVAFVESLGGEVDVVGVVADDAPLTLRAHFPKESLNTLREKLSGSEQVITVRLIERVVDVDEVHILPAPAPGGTEPGAGSSTPGSAGSIGIGIAHPVSPDRPVVRPLPMPVDLLKVCPDEWIVNKMPRIVPDHVEIQTYPTRAIEVAPMREYVILDGKRQELHRFDLDWVKENCDIEIQEVF